MTSLSLPPPRKAPPPPPPPPPPPVATAADYASNITPSSSRNSSKTTSSTQATTTTAAAARPKPSTSHNNSTIPPSYEERCRAAAALSRLSPEERRNHKPNKLFVPRSLQDFGDGGAFPEIHVAQYPRHMGNPHLHHKKTTAGGKGGIAAAAAAAPLRGAQANTSTAIVNVEIDADTGKVAYDAIVKRGTNRDKKVYSRLDDLRGGPAREEDIALPTPEEEQAEAEKTQAALNAILASKTALDKPSGSALQNAATSTQNQGNNTQFIKYTPRPDAPGYNPAAAQRIIQMVPAQVDPMMPPKHKHLKAPRGPADDPVPVLHAPPSTKLTKQERDAWNIPACISNWKNARGYTIPLDKRLAADGRGLLEHSINENFGTLSESLYVAERQARQEVRLRATVQKKLALQEKERRQEELRILANQARLERGGGIQQTTTTTTMATTTTLAGGAAPAVAASRASFSDTDEEEEDRTGGDDRKEDDFSGDDDDEKPAGRRLPQQPQQHQQQQQQRRPETEEDVAARQREKLRVERKREREKEMRFEKTQEAKKKRLEEERDVSEKIALGVYTGSGGGGGGGDAGGDVDSRLYNQTGGMDTGFGAEDDYNMYTKPMFDRDPGQSSSIYRPTRGETEHTADDQYTKLVHGATAKFVPDRGFAGAESGGGGGGAGPRTAPVQFEKGGQK